MAAAEPERRARRLEHLSQDELQPLLEQFAAGYPPVLLDFAQVIFVELLNQQHDGDGAARLAYVLTEAVRRESGGQRVYMTRGTFFEARVRADQIRAQWDGGNTAALARQYGLSVERARQIVAVPQAERRRAEAAELAELQGELPLGPADNDEDDGA